MTTKIISVLGALIVFGTLFGASYFLEDRYASAKDLDLIAMRLEQKIQQDRSSSLQQRIWKLEDRYEGEMPSEIYEEYRIMKEDKKQIDILLESLFPPIS